MMDSARWIGRLLVIGISKDATVGSRLEVIATSNKKLLCHRTQQNKDDGDVGTDGKVARHTLQQWRRALPSTSLGLRRPHLGKPSACRMCCLMLFV